MNHIMTPEQHAAYIRQLEFKLDKAEHGMGMPYSAADVAHYRRLIAEAKAEYPSPEELQEARADLYGRASDAHLS